MDPFEYNFPVFKGLQKPLEFMGLRGRFLIYAAMGCGVSFIGGFIVMFTISNTVGAIFMLVAIIISLLTIYIKQKQGLYGKKKCKNILIYTNLYNG